MMDYSCAIKFGDFSFSRFGFMTFIVQTESEYRITQTRLNHLLTRLFVLILNYANIRRQQCCM